MPADDDDDDEAAAEPLLPPPAAPTVSDDPTMRSFREDADEDDDTPEPLPALPGFAEEPLLLALDPPCTLLLLLALRPNLGVSPELAPDSPVKEEEEEEDVCDAGGRGGN